MHFYKLHIYYFEMISCWPIFKLSSVKLFHSFNCSTVTSYFLEIAYKLSFGCTSCVFTLADRNHFFSSIVRADCILLKVLKLFLFLPILYHHLLNYYNHKGFANVFHFFAQHHTVFHCC